jgi:hypothetical protein
VHLSRGLILMILASGLEPAAPADDSAVHAAIGDSIRSVASVSTGRQICYEATTGRRYVLYVPIDYNEQRAYPLVISSHGTYQDGDTEMDGTGPNSCCDRGTPTWPTLAEENDIIVACPDMTGAHGDPPFDSTQLVQLASDDNVITHVVSEVQATYNVDVHRMLITGFSGGGHVAHYVGLRHPTLFKASCARHGNFDVRETPSPLPDGILYTAVYLFTGSNDGVTGTSEAIAWYTSQGFRQVDTATFTTYPSSEHTTDRHHALSWFLVLNTPAAVITTIPAHAEGVVPLTVAFDASGSYDRDSDGDPPQIVSYEWDFTDDGMYDEIHTFPTAGHEYATAGTYTCRLRVTDNEGMTAETAVMITAKNVPGDFDGDGDVDQEDFGHLQACYAGSGEPVGAGCEDAVLDGDEDVDQQDFTVFMSCMSGANNPANPHCAQ